MPLALPRQSADHIVRLHARHPQHRKAHGLDQLVQKPELRPQVVRHRRAVGLVLGVQIVAEIPPRRVEHQADMGFGIIGQQLAQHVGDAKDRPGGFALGIAQIRQGVEGAVQERRTVDEDQGFGGSVGHGRDFREKGNMGHSNPDARGSAFTSVTGRKPRLGERFHGPD